MRKTKRFSSLFGSRHSRCYAKLMVLTLLLAGLAAAGCQNQADKMASDRFQYNRYAQHVTGVHYPNFIFDGGADSAGQARQISSEDFGRYEWPGGAQTQTYVSSGEQITYREYFYDDQYVNSNGQPRVRFHRQLRGYRSGRQYR